MTSHNESPGVTLEIDGEGLATLTIGRADEKVVTFTHQRMEELEAALNEIERREIRALVLRGARDDMFVAGADIHSIRDVEEEGRRVPAWLAVDRRLSIASRLCLSRRSPRSAAPASAAATSSRCPAT